jgi:hypothetical protein
MQLVSVEVGSVNPVKPCPKPINRVLEYEHHVPVDKKRDDRGDFEPAAGRHAFVAECDLCDEKPRCSGFFTTGKPRYSRGIQPIKNKSN